MTDEWIDGYGYPPPHLRKRANEPTVQVPVSLIERLQLAIREGLYPDAPEWADLDHQLASLFPQPTPTTETYQSIVQLAEGSTFYARQHGDRQERFWFLAAGMGVVSLDAVMAHANSIDPSTIRDVTPPT